MQIVSLEDNLHDMSKPTSMKKLKNINLSSAKFDKRVLKCSRMFQSDNPTNWWYISIDQQP